MERCLSSCSIVKANCTSSDCRSSLEMLYPECSCPLIITVVEDHNQLQPVYQMVSVETPLDSCSSLSCRRSKNFPQEKSPNPSSLTIRPHQLLSKTRFKSVSLAPLSICMTLSERILGLTRSLGLRTSLCFSKGGAASPQLNP